MIGKSLSHYKIVEEIGAGGMGEVYRASDSKLGRDVALKILPEAFAEDPERLARDRGQDRARSAAGNGLELLPGRWPQARYRGVETHFRRRVGKLARAAPAIVGARRLRKALCG